VNPSVGALPSTNDGQQPPLPSSISRLDSAPAHRLYAWAASEGPLGGHLTPAIKRRLTQTDRGTGKHFVRAMTLFALWHQRHRHRLREVDPSVIL
jgi:hypothetical protein